MSNYFNDQIRFCYKYYKRFNCRYDDNGLHMRLDNII